LKLLFATDPTGLQIPGTIAIPLTKGYDPKYPIKRDREALMTALIAYRVRTTLLCVDRQARALISLEPGTEVTYVSEEDSGMVILRRAGREILAFAPDFEDRAEAVRAANA
jgi:hypothetical protein